MTTLSTRGMIEIISHEGVCLDPYLDSVGVWTIGIGQTKSDGINPKGHGRLTLQGAFDLFKRKITDYSKAVDALKLPLSQTQYDALVSFCYNCGPGNLRKLCKGRTLAQIGDAIMLYTIPKEITPRRQKEQNLFKRGIYSNTNCKVLLFPVKNSKPRYSEGEWVNALPYFATGPSVTQGTLQSAPLASTATKVAPSAPKAPESPQAAPNASWLSSLFGAVSKALTRKP